MLSENNTFKVLNNSNFQPKKINTDRRDISPVKVKYFKQLFSYIERNCRVKGDDVCSFVGFSNTTINRLKNKNKVTAGSARKIINAYNKIKKNHSKEKPDAS